MCKCCEIKVKFQEENSFIKTDFEHINTKIGDKNFIFVQALPSTEWTIQHDLDKYPSVSVVDPNNNSIFGDVTYLSKSLLKVNFTALTSGVAYLN